jgi:hypothetical protein
MLPYGYVLLYYSGGDYQLFTAMLWSAVCDVGVFVLIFEFSEKNKPQFLNDVHIVKALNYPVDDSGSIELNYL